jgi:Kef-type K+ transport system membrane component KefB
MDTSLILILILAFAFAATHLEKRFLVGKIRLFHGLEYLLIGILVGPQVLEFLGSETTNRMAPLLSVITGLLGFIYGLPLVARGSKGRMPGGIRVGFAVTLLTAATVGGLSMVAITWLKGGDRSGYGLAAVTLGFGAVACSAESIITTISSTRSQGPISTLLPRAAATMRVMAICGLGIATAVAHGMVGHSFYGLGLGTVGWVSLTLALGVIIGVIFHIFEGEEQERERLFVATIGVVALASGVAYALQLSPLFVNLVAGATVANLSPSSERLNAAVARLRRPFDATLLLLAGAAWLPIPALMWLLPVGFVVVRAFALRFSTWLATRRNPTLDPSIPRLGNGLLSQGPLTVAIAVNYHMVPTHALMDIVFTCLIVSGVVNEFWAGSAIRRVLQNGGETGRGPVDETHDFELPIVRGEDHSEEAWEA